MLNNKTYRITKHTEQIIPIVYDIQMVKDTEDAR